MMCAMGFVIVGLYSIFSAIEHGMNGAHDWMGMCAVVLLFIQVWWG